MESWGVTGKCVGAGRRGDYGLPHRRARRFAMTGFENAAVSRRGVGDAAPTKCSKKCGAGGRTEASAPTNRIINFRRAAPMCAAARHPSHSQRRGTRAPPYGSIAGGAAANGGRGRIPPLRGTWGCGAWGITDCHVAALLAMTGFSGGQRRPPLRGTGSAADVGKNAAAALRRRGVLGEWI